MFQPSGVTTEIVLGAISAVTTITAAAFGYFDRKHKRRIAELTEFCKTVVHEDNEDVSMLVLGPRQCGKTSIVKTWCKLWEEVLDQKATASWEDHSLQILEYREETFLDPGLNISRKRKTCLRFKIRDYAGEDDKRVDALDQIKKLTGEAVIVFCLWSGNITLVEERAGRNSEYYSLAFMKHCWEAVSVSKAQFRAVAIVFTQIDKYFESCKDDAEEAMNKLAAANSMAIKNIKRVFGSVERQYLTSALTNYGVMNVLRDFEQRFVTSTGKRKPVGE